MKEFIKGQKVWVYTYDDGFFSAVFDRYSNNNSAYVLYHNKNKTNTKLFEKSQIHQSERLATDYATAINYKRGWLKREFEKYPNSAPYKQQKEDSIESFPEMWI